MHISSKFIINYDGHGLLKKWKHISLQEVATQEKRVYEIASKYG